MSGRLQGLGWGERAVLLAALLVLVSGGLLWGVGSASTRTYTQYIASTDSLGRARQALTEARLGLARLSAREPGLDRNVVLAPLVRAQQAARAGLAGQSGLTTLAASQPPAGELAAEFAEFIRALDAFGLAALDADGLGAPGTALRLHRLWSEAERSADRLTERLSATLAGDVARERRLLALVVGLWLLFVVGGALLLLAAIRKDRASRLRLLASEAGQQALLAALGDGVFVVQGGCFVWANPALLTLLGYAQVEDFVGRDPAQVIAPEFLALWHPREHGAEEGLPALPGRCELRLLRRTPADAESGGGDGEVWVELHAVVAPFAGRPALIGVARDIGARRAALSAALARTGSFEPLPVAVDADAGADAHYLRRELYAQVQSNPAIFDFLQAGSLDGLWYWDLERPEHEWMNARFWRVLGYDPATKQHLAAEWQDLIFPEDLALAIDNFRRHCADARHPYDQIVRYRHADGSTVWVRCRGIAIRDAAGRALRMLGAHTDVTGIMRAEEARSAAVALAESERRLRELADSLPQLVWTCRPDGWCDFLSRRWVEYTGQPEAAQLGSGWLEHVYPDDRERLVAAWTAAVAGGHDFSVEFRIRRAADGAWRWFDTRALPLRDAQGRIVRWFGTNTDVQAARETAEALRASEARFRALLDQAADAIYVHDADGRLCDVNHRACETLGLPRATLLTMNVADVDPALPAAGLAFWHTLTPGESLTLRSRHRRGDGSDFPVELSVGAVEIGGERRLLALARDISERERAEAEIHELNASLEQRVAERTAELTAANRELDAFAYAVSHDLRAPLRAMSGFSTALLEDCAGQLDADGRAYLDQIIAGSRRMGELIDGLLALSRSTRGELRRERVDVTAIMARVREELEADEPQRRVHWQVEPDLHVWGDAGMLDAVFANLAGNAWKYTARTADPVIRVQAAEAAAGFLCVCVSDNGAGFDPRHAGKLFLPFQRLHRQDEFPGLGIGLATAQRIVHRHGGTIAASAAPGLGARFCITLPGPQVASEEPES